MKEEEGEEEGERERALVGTAGELGEERAAAHMCRKVRGGGGGGEEEGEKNINMGGGRRRRAETCCQLSKHVCVCKCGMCEHVG